MPFLSEYGDRAESEEKSHINHSFLVVGMTCASCAGNVEKALKEVDGVLYASINLATEKASVTADPKVSKESLKEAVERVGYGYREKQESEDTLKTRFLEARRNLVLALAVTAPLTILMIFHMAGVKIPFFLEIELIAGSFVLFYTGRHTLRGAWIAVTHKHSNMDTLISIGAFSAWLTTVLNIAGLPLLSFGAIGAMLLTLHLIGRYLEARLKERASKDILSLLSYQSPEANLIDGEKRVTVPIEAVEKGTLLLVRTGERIPLDGRIEEGEGYADESMITGEPVPVKKEINSEVVGGTLLTSGHIVVKVTHTEDESFLSKMIQLVEEAQSSKVPIQAFTDKVTMVFIPIVFTLALAGGVVWFFGYNRLHGYLYTLSHWLPWINPDAGAVSTAIFVFVASLVIACPCALGLATPMALISGTGAAARKGLILKNGEAIQKAGEIDVICFDKTGTITLGRPVVVKSNLSKELLGKVATLESLSIHPLAKAIVASSGDQESYLGEFTNVEETAGSGISGYTAEQESLFVGRPLDAEIYRELMERGESVVEVRLNDKIAGFLSIADPVREEAVNAIEELKSEGITPVMVTGDSEVTARAVAEQVGIKQIEAGISPAGKVDIVRSFQIKGRTVAMVGDGINDAAALKSADLGLAVGTGTDLSIESADMVIVKGELSRVIEAINISRFTLRRIKQNLFWAFLYNIMALPSALAGLLHPLIAEAAMTISSLNVIINSNRREFHKSRSKE